MNVPKSTKPHIDEKDQHVSEVLILEQFMSLLLKINYVVR